MCVCACVRAGQRCPSAGPVRARCGRGAGAWTSWAARPTSVQRAPTSAARGDAGVRSASSAQTLARRLGRRALSSAAWTRCAPCAAQLRAWRALERRHALRTAGQCVWSWTRPPLPAPPTERPGCAAPAAAPGLRPCAPHHSVGRALPRFACWAALPLQCLSARAALGATHIRAAFCIPGGPAPRAPGLPPPSAASGPRQHPPSLPCAGVVLRLGRSTFRPAAPLRARQTCASGAWNAAPPWQVSFFAGFDAARSRRPPCRAGARQLGPAPAIQRQAFGASRLTLRPARNPPPRCFRRANPRPAAVGR